MQVCLLLITQLYILITKECGVNLDGVNPRYIELDRDAGKGFRYNYVECFCAEDRRSELCDKLKAKEYGALEAVELSREEGRNIILFNYGPQNYVIEFVANPTNPVDHPTNPVDHPDYCIIKFSILNEAGSLVRALNAFVVS